MKMTNRELETRYMHMKQTWKTLVDANVNLVDENKDLKEEIERLHNIIKEVREYINNHQLVFEMSSKKQILDWFDMFYKQLLEILDKTN